MQNRYLLTIIYGLITIWTGLWRGIEAQAYKPNALWFCLVMGLVAIAGGFLYRLKKERAAMITTLVAVLRGISLKRLSTTYWGRSPHADNQGALGLQTGPALWLRCSGSVANR